MEFYARVSIVCGNLSISPIYQSHSHTGWLDLNFVKKCNSISILGDPGLACQLLVESVRPCSADTRESDTSRGEGDSTGPRQTSKSTVASCGLAHWPPFGINEAITIISSLSLFSTFFAIYAVLFPLTSSLCLCIQFLITNANS